MSRLTGDKYVVADFGDFSAHQVPNLLRMYKVNEAYIQGYAGMLFGVIEAVNDWIRCTGKEFVIDPKMFRLAFAQTSEGSVEEHRNT